MSFLECLGPFGDRDNYQVFVQKCVPYTDQVFVRLSSTGKRLCTIKSIDYSTITSFCVHECEGPSRLNSRPRRYLFTGHSNGTIQMWDLTTALELKLTHPDYLATYQQQHQQQQPRDLTMYGLGGPTPSEFAKLLDRIELASTTSGYSTPTTTNCFSPCGCSGGAAGTVVNSSSFGNMTYNFANNNGSSGGCGGGSGGTSKYTTNKNLLINSAAGLTGSSTAMTSGGAAVHTIGGLAHAFSGSHHAAGGSIMHHQNLHVDDESKSNQSSKTTTTSND